MYLDALPMQNQCLLNLLDATDPPRDDDTNENLIVGYASIEGECRDTGARSEVPEGEVRNTGEVLCDDEVCRICCVRCLYSFRELCVCCYRC